MNFFQIVNFETLTNGFRVELLDFIALASIIAGVFVVISKNPIVSVLFLIGLFCSISGYLFALGIIYIGLAYLLVYVGAVSILFLFILMLINVRISELLFDTSNSRPLAIIISVLFFSIVGFSIPNYRNGLLVLGKIWDGILAETNHITSIGNIMYTHLSIWLIIASIILLLAMVGAIVITIKSEFYGSLSLGVVLNILPKLNHFLRLLFNSILFGGKEFFLTLSKKNIFSRIKGSFFLQSKVFILGNILLLAGMATSITNIVVLGFVFCIYVRAISILQTKHKPNFSQWISILTAFALGYIIIITPFWFTIGTILELNLFDPIFIITSLSGYLTNIDFMDPSSGGSGGSGGWGGSGGSGGSGGPGGNDPKPSAILEALAAHNAKKALEDKQSSSNTTQPVGVDKGLSSDKSPAKSSTNINEGSTTKSYFDKVLVKQTPRKLLEESTKNYLDKGKGIANVDENEDLREWDFNKNTWKEEGKTRDHLRVCKVLPDTWEGWCWTELDKNTVVDGLLVEKGCYVGTIEAPLIISNANVEDLSQYKPVPSKKIPAKELISKAYKSEDNSLKGTSNNVLSPEDMKKLDQAHKYCENMAQSVQYETTINGNDYSVVEYSNALRVYKNLLAKYEEKGVDIKKIEKPITVEVQVDSGGYVRIPVEQIYYPLGHLSRWWGAWVPGKVIPNLVSKGDDVGEDCEILDENEMDDLRKKGIVFRGDTVSKKD